MRRMYSKSQIEKIIDEHGGGGSGAVNSVNGKVGKVVLDATDIKLTTNKQTVQNNFIRIDSALDEKQDKLVAGNNITISGNVISASGGGGSYYISEDIYNEQLTLGDTSSTICPKTIGINTTGDSSSTSIYSDATGGISSYIDLSAEAWNSGKMASINIAASDEEGDDPAYSRINLQADQLLFNNGQLVAYDSDNDRVLIYVNMLPQDDPYIDGVLYVDSDTNTLKVSRSE